MPRARSTGVVDRLRAITLQTATLLKKELESIDAERRRMLAGFEEASRRISETLRALGHTNGVKTAKPIRAKKRRIRRGPEELSQEAEAIIQLVRGSGAQGATGKEIRQKHPKVGPDIKGFVRKHGKQKLRSTGLKSTMRYFVK